MWLLLWLYGNGGSDSLTAEETWVLHHPPPPVDDWGGVGLGEKTGDRGMRVKPIIKTCANQCECRATKINDSNLNAKYQGTCAVAGVGGCSLFYDKPRAL